MLKGIQTVADAKQAVAMGVEGIGLSNHGGRQLDDAPAPIELVEPVRDEVGDEATIICDGGVRRGSDIVKAIALGADAVSMGRPYLYALGAAGERGVDQLLGFIREGLERTMALTGRRSVARDRPLSGATPGLGQLPDSGPCLTAYSSPSPTVSPTSASTVPTSATHSTTPCSTAIAEAGEQLKSESGCACRRAARATARRSVPASTSRRSRRWPAATVLTSEAAASRGQPRLR